jgi:alpha-amylase
MFNEGGWGDVKGELSGCRTSTHDNPQVLDYFVNTSKTGSRRARSQHPHGHRQARRAQVLALLQVADCGEHPDVCLIGEVLFEGKDDIATLLEYQNYHDFDSIFDFPPCTALRSTLIYDESIRYWLARPRLNDNEPLGVLDNDNPFKGGYRNANRLVTLLDNHDLQRRIMSHARTKHPGIGAGLDWAVRVTKLCLGALFTMRGIPQLYYGTEIGLEGWKDADDRDLRRDFPWDAIGNDHHAKPHLYKEHQIYEWTWDLIRLRKSNAALSTARPSRCGRTIWSTRSCASPRTTSPWRSSTTATSRWPARSI